MPTKSFRVSFRLDAASGRSLAAKARRHDASPSVHARELILRALEQDVAEDLADLREEVAALCADLKGELGQLKTEVRKVAAAVLQMAEKGL